MGFYHALHHLGIIRLLYSYEYQYEACFTSINPSQGKIMKGLRTHLSTVPFSPLTDCTGPKFYLDIFYPTPTFEITKICSYDSLSFHEPLTNSYPQATSCHLNCLIITIILSLYVFLGSPEAPNILF